MKILFSEQEKDKFNIIKENDELPTLVPEKGNYSINITVEDRAKASEFIMALLHDKSLQQDIGFKVTSFNLYTAISPDQIKSYLNEALNYIDKETDRLRGDY